MKPSHSSERNAQVRWPGSRPTIAFFAPALGAGLYYQKWQIWGGVARVCRERGANLLYIAGGQSDSTPGAMLYPLVNDRLVDGIVSWTGVVTSRLNAEAARAFFARFAPVPIVNVGWHLPGVHSLAFDQAEGMRDLLRHLIEVHGFRRIAYIMRDTGHIGFEYQYAGYEDTLRRLGLFDPALVVDQTSPLPLATLDERGLRPAVDYQAAVCTNDILTLAIIEELRARGLRVPQDVAVTGFHDGLEARITTPPLTTVQMPWREAGQQAAEHLLALMAGRDLAGPDRPVMIPLEVIVRQSCGCPDARTTRASAHSEADSSPDLNIAWPDAGRPLLLQAMTDAIGTRAEGLAPGWASILLDTFLADIAAGTSGAPTTFLSELNALLRQAGAAGANLNTWHDALSAMRRGLLPLLNGDALVAAEDLWQQGRVVIGQAAARGEAHQVWRLVGQAEALHQIEAALHVATDRAELLAALAELLPRLGIRRCFLAVYGDSGLPATSARLIFALDEHGPRPLPVAGLPFPAAELLPEDYWPSPRPFSLAVEALHFGDEQIGFVIFEVDPRAGFEIGTIYEGLRSQISSALKSVRLYEEVERARKEAEAANELKSRFLSVVSHELRTPLTLIAGLCEMAAWEQLRRQDDDPAALLASLRQHQDQIHAGAQHLDRLIRDVLDLASSQVGQLRLSSERVNPGELLREVAAMGRQMAQDKRLTWRAEIPDDLPDVWGDRTRLRQIVLNLLSNAAKFTAHGEIVLRAEMIGGGVTISVSDTGLGIPTSEQEAIFDEFRQSERTATRGYGGMGLGLAITRRLVELHGGTISVQSVGAEGLGSTFRFTLPALTPVTSVPNHAEIGRSQTVLVLSEEPDGATPIRRHLAEHGFVAEDLALAETPGWLDRVLTARPGAIVLDCAPTCELGWHIMRTIREHPILRDVPVLFCALIDAEASGSVLAVDYLIKPAGAEELALVLARHGLEACPDDRQHVIMLADDEPGILQLHATAIRAQLPGCRVLTAANGRDAIEMIRQEQPDLVLLDLMMPEMDGFEVLEAMREGETTRSIPVIILTGQSLTEHDMARLNRGVAAVLGKGLFTPQETLAQVEAALARDKRLGSDAQRLVRRAMAYIHDRYSQEISRADIARHLSVNESYLTHCFEREIGVPPMAYLSRYRIREARRLLESDNRAITDVAMAVGFASASYFTRVFQREVGVSPRAYQRGER
jgi:signal transduction histidine kinase/DNA-binding LacI/PurR family transcriptional regulator/DNA-binding response OmpR family regulator